MSPCDDRRETTLAVPPSEPVLSVPPLPRLAIRLRRPALLRVACLASMPVKGAPALRRRRRGNTPTPMPWPATPSPGPCQATCACPLPVSRPVVRGVASSPAPPAPCVLRSQEWRALRTADGWYLSDAAARVVAAGVLPCGRMESTRPSFRSCRPWPHTRSRPRKALLSRLRCTT